LSKLFIIPTPIGNLEDITHRALRLLKEVDILYAEDTRTTGNLLKHFGIDRKIVAFHQHNEHKILQRIIDELQTLETAGLVSDAGTPGISDPGFLLVRECIKNEIEVECLPGPTAFVPALVQSGFPCDSFIYDGFLPHKKGRQTKWKEIAVSERTVVVYESPHRIIKALEEAKEFLPEGRQLAVCREISKMFHETKRGTAAELLEYYTTHHPKGEIVVVISPAD
jgi:16S rRNA (cytidine1402-2'-O)-methyltransferase